MSFTTVDRIAPAWDDALMHDAAGVADWLSRAIRDGSYAPGQRLVEGDLVSATGAGRAAVRGALQRLSNDGLVVVEPFRGASVRLFTQDWITDLYRIREVLEGLAARLAAERALDPATLLEAQAEAESAVLAGDPHRFMQANAVWHAALVELAGNADLTASLERLRVPILRLLSRAFLTGSVVVAACASQASVTQAVVARDPDGAEFRMRAHVRAGMAAVVAMTP